MQEKTYARFRTSLLRSAVVAPVASFLVYGFAPRQVGLDPYPVLTVIFDVMTVLFLVAAVRAWVTLLRGRSELRLTGDGLTMRRGRRELSLPWDSVGKVRVDWQSKTPWVVVWLHSSVAPEQVPVSRRSDGSYRVLPIGRGRSMKVRLRQMAAFRSAGMAYAGRYVDVTSPKTSG